MDYRVHEAVWTSEKVGRFWDYENNERKYQGNWFTLQVGDGIYNYTKKFLPKNGRILDYGAGKGFLTQKILEKSSLVVDCAEFSEAGLENIRKLVSHYPCFGQTIQIKNFPLNVSNSMYDCIYFVETIEHLTDEFLMPTLYEFKRILKKDGVVIITTNNDENLDESIICCPDCGCVFHRVQHLRSFTPESMRSLMQDVGFTELWCGAVKFDYLKDGLSLNTRLLNLSRRILLRNKLPHLLYIGKNKINSGPSM
jgi:SAM-dependent methyltransferase